MKHIKLTIGHYDQTVSLDNLVKGLSEFSKSKLCRADFMLMGLGKPDSYRSYPEHLALDCDMKTYSQNGVTVGDVINWLENAVGREFHGRKGGEFHGRKGGEYEMTRDSLVWLADGHEGIGIGIVGIYDAGHEGVVLETALADDTGYGKFPTKHEDYEVDKEELAVLIDKIADLLPTSHFIQEVLGNTKPYEEVKHLYNAFDRIEGAIRIYELEKPR